MNGKTSIKKNWVIYPVGIILIGIFVCFIWCCRVHPVTTVLLIRHAERSDVPPDDPILSPAGQARAQTLVHVAGSADIKAIFATELIRTQQTVEPLAVQLGLTVIEVPAEDIEGLADQIKADYKGEVVIVAGHSNTVPLIVEELGGDSNSAVVGNNYDNLFVITLFRCGKPKVLKLKYGNPG